MARTDSKIITNSLQDSKVWDSYKCAIALGSNLGDRQLTLESALNQLNHHAQISVLRVSHWYCSQAITLDSTSIQPDYLNGCAVLSTSLSPTQLLHLLLQIETLLGRERRDRWAARTLDLDLLLYEDWIIDSPELIVPHPRMSDRAFVLIPLAEIAPDWLHPITKDKIAKLAQNLPPLKKYLEKI